MADGPRTSSSSTRPAVPAHLLVLWSGRRERLRRASEPIMTRRQAPSGTRTPSSTSCTCAPSPTPTATAEATSAASPTGSTTSTSSGVTALWLLPFYPSPLRDDGYDIADYTSIHPDYGTLGDFRRFVEEAHRRDMRVITEVVVNHTSDQHPWFQRARDLAPRQQPARLLRVERHARPLQGSPHHLPGLRVVELGLGPGRRGVLLAPLLLAPAGPQLPQPGRATSRSFAPSTSGSRLGVDGLRLDAVPYLYEEDGTDCENLPETHEFLAELRRHVDDRFSGRMLLAEANQWPEDASAYFGKGDECHMAFHFPLMPRLFMGLRMEDRFPIIDIMQQTPEIPPSCQWALFLRNHDELTLEMVTDEERDYMYRVVRPRPGHADQPGHPPAAGALARSTTGRRSS